MRPSLTGWCCRGVVGQSRQIARLSKDLSVANHAMHIIGHAYKRVAIDVAHDYNLNHIGHSHTKDWLFKVEGKQTQKGGREW